MWIAKQILAFIFYFISFINPPPSLVCRRRRRINYLVLRMQNPCRRQAIITLGANATTCRRQAGRRKHVWWCCHHALYGIMMFLCPSLVTWCSTKHAPFLHPQCQFIQMTPETTIMRDYAITAINKYWTSKFISSLSALTDAKKI